VFTTKEYMQCVTAVEPEWLAEMGPTFFSIKETHSSRLEQREKAREQKAAMEEEMKGVAVIAARKAEEEAKMREKEREKQRSSIAAIGVVKPAAGARRKFGL
jgi:pre-mRNA-splicing factor ATP-dependent RNA helicase DHX38/PRP16